MAQAAKALDRIGCDDEQKKQIMQEILELHAEKFLNGVSAHLGTEMYRIMMERTGQGPFTELREMSKKESKKIYDELKPGIASLRAACKSAVIGNTIDYNVAGHKVDIETLKGMMNEPLVIDDFEKLEVELKNVKKVLYLTDNLGEHWFDLEVVKRLNEIELDVVIAGKEKELTNDVTADELREAGFEAFAMVISIGSDTIGINWEEVSEEFRDEWNTADLVIAKGMGHYECLDDYEGKKICFMLQAKCEPVAESIGVERWESVLWLKG